MVPDLGVRAVRRGAGPEARVEPDGPHADARGPGDVRGHVVADVDDLLRRQAEAVRGRAEDPRVRLPEAQFVGVAAEPEEAADPQVFLEGAQVPSPAPAGVREE